MTKEEMLAKMDPELVPMYGMLPEYSIVPYETLCAVRQGHDDLFSGEEWSIRGREDIRLQVLRISNSDNSGELELRVYRPAALTGTLPCIFYLHGGGCVMYRAWHDDIACAAFSLQENCVIVNVDYRLAPDFPAPTGQLDALTAWNWLISEGISALDIDPEKIIIHGNSGGGNIAVGLVLRILDAGIKLPAAVVPLYPMLDDRSCTPSSSMVEDNTFWGTDLNAAAWKYYLHGQDPFDIRVPDGYTAPARRESFKGFPKTFTFVGGLELFRDEVMEMVRKMSRDGVDVEFHLYPGCCHAFEQFIPTAAVSRQALEAKHQFIQKVFNPKK